MTKVLFDYQTFHIQRFGGISRYYSEIASRMKNATTDIAISYSMNQYLIGSGLTHYTPIPKRLFKIFEGVFRKLNRNASIKAIQKGNFDVFHPTYYDPYFLDTLNGKPFVLTIHDMTHERFPNMFSPNDKTTENKRILAEKASRIIAISECTKNDIIRYLGIDENKIDIIYHGITPQPIPLGKPQGLCSKYILYVGERRSYKNFDTTILAFEKINHLNPDIHLVLTGRPLSKGEERVFTEKGLTEYIHVYSDVSDIVLLQLYHNALLFVYPSLYEGFGIPILEAFSQDCPVVLSNASCFPEVAGNAAKYFNPLSADSMAEAMSELINNDAQRQELIERGRERLKLFTWDNTAKKTEAIYDCLKLTN